jgi:sugar lactone lactonase YvrE
MLAIPCAPSAPVERRELSWHGPGLVQAYLVGNRVGEAPVWDARRGCLWWIDVRAQQVLRLEPDDSLVTRWTFPTPLGALALASDGRLAVAMRHALVLFDPATGEMQAHAVLEEGVAGNRLNDGKVSPSGQWWVVGSMDDAPSGKRPTGALYRVGAEGSVATLHRGLTVANGIAWDRAGTTLYFSDSHAGRIWRAAWDEPSGTMGTPQLMAVADEEAGRPDGAWVDADDGYWSAGVSAGRLNRFRDGRLDASLELPCRAPTMPCFGGPGLQELYVTSLVRPTWPSDSGGIDGALLRMPSPVRGTPAALWAVEAGAPAGIAP